MLWYLPLRLGCWLYLHVGEPHLGQRETRGLLIFLSHQLLNVWFISLPFFSCLLPSALNNSKTYYPLVGWKCHSDFRGTDFDEESTSGRIHSRGRSHESARGAASQRTPIIWKWRHTLWIINLSGVVFLYSRQQNVFLLSFSPIMNDIYVFGFINIVHIKCDWLLTPLIFVSFHRQTEPDPYSVSCHTDVTNC